MSEKRFMNKVMFPLFMIMVSALVNAQVSQGGMPYGLSKSEYLSHHGMRKINSLANIPVFTMPLMDNKALLSSGSRNYDSESFDFAKEIECAINIKKVAIIDSLPEGLLYRCAIESPTAFSIHLVFSNFHIPIGAKLFLYNESGKQILGAFTSNNNKASHIFAVAPIFSDKIIIEYFEPYYAEHDGVIEVGQVYHGYMDISENIESTLDGTCEVDINCSEGNNWQTEKRSVCKIIFGSSACSGSLINNTNFDGTPYFLTANHCISTEEIANICILYFNYENSTCGITNMSSLQTLSGATLKATSINTDFTLLQILEPPNIIFQPYYAGWDRNISHGEGGVGIHHPRLLPKKISTYEIAPKLNSCKSPLPNNFYLIDEWVATEHGHGVTEGGSSGSPLFNNKHRIIGQLYGGCAGHNANCDNPSNDYSVYGKFYLSWDAGGSSSTQLKNWLDPTNKNYMYIDGLNTCDNSGIMDISIHYPIEDDGVVALYTTNYIESMATIESGAVVSYVAKDYIKLKNGFQVKKGAEFQAIISNTLCNSFAPMSVANWTPSLSNENILEYNVTNATHYKIMVHTLYGELIYSNQDTVVSNSIAVWKCEHKLNNDTDIFIVTIVFGNNYEEISNTYLLASDINKSISRVNSSQDRNTINMPIENILDLDITPNPVKDFMEIEVVAKEFTPFNINMFSISGQHLLRLDYINTNKINVNIGELPPGEYVMQIQMGNRLCSKQFIKY